MCEGEKNKVKTTWPPVPQRYTHVLDTGNVEMRLQAAPELKPCL